MAEQQTRAQRLFDRVSGGNFDVGGIPVGDIVGVVRDVVKRKPNVKAWAQAKRNFKRNLRAQGLDRMEQKQMLRQWLAKNPKPKGSDPYNPVALGTSNQMNGNAQANIQNPAGNEVFPVGGIPIKTQKAGLGFNPLFLLLLLPFVFPKQFRGLRKSLKI